MEEIRSFTGGFTMTNGWVFPTAAGTIVIDAPEGMLIWLKKQAFQVTALFLSHCHFDHVIDAAAIRKHYGCPIFAWEPSTKEGRLEHLLEVWFDKPVIPAIYDVDFQLKGLPEITVSGETFLLQHVPGHSLDSVVFIHEASRTIFSGDTVMDGGIGRTDFPDGSHDLLVKGIEEKILTLPPDYLIHPGHGGISAVADERRAIQAFK